MVATATAKISCPATLTRFLRMNMTVSQPRLLFIGVDSFLYISHIPFFIIYKTMTGKETSISRNPHITSTSTTRIGTVGSLMNLM